MDGARHEFPLDYQDVVTRAMSRLILTTSPTILALKNRRSGIVRMLKTRHRRRTLKIPTLVSDLEQICNRCDTWRNKCYKFRET